MLFVIAPADLGAGDEAKLRSGVPGVVSAVAKEFRSSLDSHPSLAEALPADSKTGIVATGSLEQALNSIIARTDGSFVFASRRFDQQLKAMMPTLSGRVSLGVAVRACDAPKCTLDDFSLDSTRAC